MHFVIKEMATAYVDFLPITKEKYISFTKHVDRLIFIKIDKKNCVKSRFIDSFWFLVSSLDKLTSFLNKDKLWILQHEFSNLSRRKF